MAQVFDRKDTENKKNMTAKEQLVEIAKRVKQLLPVKDDAYSAIMDGLKNYGVEHLAVKDLSPEEDAYFRAFFTREIQPLTKSTRCRSSRAARYTSA